MIWLIISGFFASLLLREIYHRHVPRNGFDRPDDSPLPISYLLITAGLSLAFAYPPFMNWQFERFLTAKARLLAETPRASVHCNTVFDTFFDTNSLAAGHAMPETGRIVLQYPWCKRLRQHLSAPKAESREGIFSVQLFVHETMHIRGELNEALTECQAIQRHYRGARLLGVPEVQARQSGLTYYNENYRRRAGIDGLGGQYYSEHCAPGKALDERLSDSTWN